MNVLITIFGIGVLALSLVLAIVHVALLYSNQNNRFLKVVGMIFTCLGGPVAYLYLLVSLFSGSSRYWQGGTNALIQKMSWYLDRVDEKVHFPIIALIIVLFIAGEIILLFNKKAEKLTK